MNLFQFIFENREKCKSEVKSETHSSDFILFFENERVGGYNDLGAHK